MFQLKVGLSPLKCHKRRHNFRDTLTDKCDCTTDSEDTEHFLLKCPLFQRERLKLLTSTQIILAPKDLLHLVSDFNLFLYGSHLLNATENKAILKSSVSYILETNRFN